MKKIYRISILIMFSLIIVLTSCEKDETLKKTYITFNMTDETGNTGDCYYRIIEPVADPTKPFTINAKYQANIGWNGSHEFNDIEPGSYAAIIGGIGETYKAFSIAKGEHVTINVKCYAAYYVQYGFYRVPIRGWLVNINKD